MSPNITKSFKKMSKWLRPPTLISTPAPKKASRVKCLSKLFLRFTQKISISVLKIYSSVCHIRTFLKQFKTLTKTFFSKSRTKKSSRVPRNIRNSNQLSQPHAFTKKTTLTNLRNFPKIYFVKKLNVGSPTVNQKYPNSKHSFPKYQDVSSKDTHKSKKVRPKHLKVLPKHIEKLPKVFAKISRSPKKNIPKTSNLSLQMFRLSPEPRVFPLKLPKCITPKNAQ